MTSNHRLKVGIDFGTTFSGISWVHTKKPDDVNVIMKWPGAPHASVKVPSEILYSSDGSVHKWGYQLKFPDEPIAWFKLLLHPTRYDFADCSMLSGTQSLASPKKGVDIVADYLSCLRVHFLEIISGSLGKAFLNATPIDYTLTVPAIWKDPAKALTLEAAEKAGLGTKDTIRLMSEPDAAAAWTLLRDISQNNLKVGDAFVVVDCGGGTVDLISYQVQNLHPLTVNECVKGTGGLCGSVFLNERFLDLVKLRIGDLFKKMKPATRHRMVNEWELVLKRVFSNSAEEGTSSCPIGPIPDNPKLRIFDSELLINREEMLSIFDPIIDQIITLVQEQIDMVAAKNDRELRISAVLLVGGFGQSNYLKQRLEMALTESQGTTNSAIEILQPTNGWSAISRGAALGIRISSRKARRHYGVASSVPFIHGVHPLKALSYNSYTGEARCLNSIKWFIEKYEHVSEDKPISLAFHRMVWLSETLKFRTGVVDCDEDEPPGYAGETSGTKLGQPCIAHCDLTAVPKDLFTRKESPTGKPYYDISYNLVMTIRSGDVHFGVEFQGKSYGTAKVQYEHD